MILLPGFGYYAEGLQLFVSTSSCVVLARMGSRAKIEKWLLADWSTGRNNQTKQEVDLKVEPDRREEIATEYEHILEQDKNSKANESTRRSMNVDSEVEEEKDYSPSCSSWEPSNESSSEESDTNETNSKNMKIEQYMQHFARQRKSKKTLTPVHRPNAVVDVLQERQINANNRSFNRGHKRKYKDIVTSNRSLPDSTRINNLPPKHIAPEKVAVNIKDLLQIKASFEQLFTMINKMKPKSERQEYVINNNIIKDNRKSDLPENNTTVNSRYYENEEIENGERSQSEESHRSDDNVLISNKYTKIRNSPKNEKQNERLPERTKSPNAESEWIPIGSGKTLIHKDKYQKVNWKSYTVATRTLLLATFPRRVLATHSLTGKRSPAFQDKPVKMCLDPKIVSDIIIEITSKFNIKENLVRTIITTKCADECKMYKTRLKKIAKIAKSQENLSPAMKKTKED